MGRDWAFVAILTALFSLIGFMLVGTPYIVYYSTPVCPLGLIEESQYRGTVQNYPPGSSSGYAYLSLSEFQIQADNTRITRLVAPQHFPFMGPMYYFYSDTVLPPIYTQCRLT